MNVLNAIAITLLIGVLSIIPAALLGQYVPGVFNPGLKPVAVAAWVSGLAAWFVSRHVTKSEQEAARESARQQSGSTGVAITVGFFVLAIGIAAVLHFFGDSVFVWVR